jgi:Uma2 family endonuclease
MGAPERHRPTTVEELRALPDHDRLELVSGEVVAKAHPSPDHGFSKCRLGGVLHDFNRRPGQRVPGGWWLMSGLHVQYELGEVYCHDMAGWRRDQRPERPSDWPARFRPDWVCEIISPEHERQDLIVKPRTLHAAAVPHYWALHPEEKMLLVYRWASEGYMVVLTASSGDRVRAEPFTELELDVSELFGDESDE